MPASERGPFEVELLRELPGLRRRARRLTLREDTAEDLLQDTLEKSLNSWQRFRPGSNLGAWLAVIMQNLYIDRRRRMKAQRLTDRQLPPLQTDADGDASLELWEAMDPSDVPALLDRLHPRLRQAMELVVLGRWSYREASAHLGVPTATVGTRLVRARSRLRALARHRSDASVPGEQ